MQNITFIYIIVNFLIRIRSETFWENNKIEGEKIEINAYGTNSNIDSLINTVKEGLNSYITSGLSWFNNEIENALFMGCLSNSCTHSGIEYMDISTMHQMTNDDYHYATQITAETQTPSSWMEIQITNPTKLRAIFIRAMYKNGGYIRLFNKDSMFAERRFLPSGFFENDEIYFKKLVTDGKLQQTADIEKWQKNHTIMFGQEWELNEDQRKEICYRIRIEMDIDEKGRSYCYAGTGDCADMTVVQFGARRENRYNIPDNVDDIDRTGIYDIRQINEYGEMITKKQYPFFTYTSYKFSDGKIHNLKDIGTCVNSPIGKDFPEYHVLVSVDPTGHWSTFKPISADIEEYTINYDKNGNIINDSGLSKEEIKFKKIIKRRKRCATKYAVSNLLKKIQICNLSSLSEQNKNGVPALYIMLVHSASYARDSLTSENDAKWIKLAIIDGGITMYGVDFTFTSMESVYKNIIINKNNSMYNTYDLYSNNLSNCGDNLINKNWMLPPYNENTKKNHRYTTLEEKENKKNYYKHGYFNPITGSCYCGLGYTGEKCSKPVCSMDCYNEIDGNSICIEPGKCNCSSKSIGYDCRFDKFSATTRDGWNSKLNNDNESFKILPLMNFTKLTYHFSEKYLENTTKLHKKITDKKYWVDEKCLNGTNPFLTPFYCKFNNKCYSSRAKCTIEMRKGKNSLSIDDILGKPLSITRKDAGIDDNSLNNMLYGICNTNLKPDRRCRLNGSSNRDDFNYTSNEKQSDNSIIEVIRNYYDNLRLIMKDTEGISYASYLTSSSYYKFPMESEQKLFGDIEFDITVIYKNDLDSIESARTINETIRINRLKISTQNNSANSPIYGELILQYIYGSDNSKRYPTKTYQIGSFTKAYTDSIYLLSNTENIYENLAKMLEEIEFSKTKYPDLDSIPNGVCLTLRFYKKFVRTNDEFILKGLYAYGEIISRTSTMILNEPSEVSTFEVTHFYNSKQNSTYNIQFEISDNEKCIENKYEPIYSNKNSIWKIVDKVLPEYFNTTENAKNTIIIPLAYQKLKIKCIRSHFMLRFDLTNKFSLSNGISSDSFTVYGLKGLYPYDFDINKNTSAYLPERKSLSEMLGVNVVWGFPEDKFANLTASNIRDYHNVLSWDTGKNPNKTPLDFTKMAFRKGTNTMWWLNYIWSYVPAIIDNGFLIQVSLQFSKNQLESEKDSNDDISYIKFTEEGAYNYAYCFAYTYGPLHGNGFVQTVEVGNEFDNWSGKSATFTIEEIKLFTRGFLRGFKEADPSIRVTIAAISIKMINEILLDETIFEYLDALNIHAYSSKNTQRGYASVEPESKHSGFRMLDSIMIYREKNNLQNLPVFLGEFGYDSAYTESTVNISELNIAGTNDEINYFLEDYDEITPDVCVFTRCVSESDQGLLTLRSLLIAASKGFDTASIYFYGDTGYSPFQYSRSGLVTTEDREYTKKRSMFIMEKAMELIGSFVYKSTISKSYSEEYYGSSESNLKNPFVIVFNHRTNENISEIIAWIPGMNSTDSTSTNYTDMIKEKVKIIIPLSDINFTEININQIQYKIYEIGHIEIIKIEANEYTKPVIKNGNLEIELYLTIFPRVIVIEKALTQTNSVIISCPSDCINNGGSCSLNNDGQLICNCSTNKFTIGNEYCKYDKCVNDCFRRGKCIPRTDIIGPGEPNTICKCENWYNLKSGIPCTDFQKCDKIKFDPLTACRYNTCKSTCSNHGYCKNGSCLCTSAWRGEECEKKSCSRNCRNRGRCTDNGNCICGDVNSKGKNLNISKLFGIDCMWINYTDKLQVRWDLEDFMRAHVANVKYENELYNNEYYEEHKYIEKQHFEDISELGPVPSDYWEMLDEILGKEINYNRPPKEDDDTKDNGVCSSLKRPFKCLLPNKLIKCVKSRGECALLQRPIETQDFDFTTKFVKEFENNYNTITLYKSSKASVNLNDAETYAKGLRSQWTSGACYEDYYLRKELNSLYKYDLGDLTYNKIFIPDFSEYITLSEKKHFNFEYKNKIISSKEDRVLTIYYLPLSQNQSITLKINRYIEENTENETHEKLSSSKTFILKNAHGNEKKIKLFNQTRTIKVVHIPLFEDVGMEYSKVSFDLYSENQYDVYLISMRLIKCFEYIQIEYTNELDAYSIVSKHMAGSYGIKGFNNGEILTLNYKISMDGELWLKIRKFSDNSDVFTKNTWNIPILVSSYKWDTENTTKTKNYINNYCNRKTNTCKFKFIKFEYIFNELDAVGSISTDTLLYKSSTPIIGIKDFKIYKKGGINGLFIPKKEEFSSYKKPTVGQMMGVNAVLEFGVINKESYLEPDEKNGEMNYIRFKDVAQHLRNYHNMSWEIDSTSRIPNFENMPGSLKFGWLDWDSQYSKWNSYDLEPQASIQFLKESFPAIDWTIYGSFNYGYMFAKHFGFNNTANVPTTEIGNEPDYDLEFYIEKIMRPMSIGLKTADSSITVPPAAYVYNNLESIAKIYTKETIEYLDAFNIHAYSWIEQNGQRRGVNPENQDGTFIRSLLRTLRFRQENNLFNMPIYVSEFGWTSAEKTLFNYECKNSACISMYDEAIYTIRAILLMARYGIERASVFFYADATTCGTTNEDIFSCSGILGLKLDKKNNILAFIKKPLWYALYTMKRIIGNYVFEKAICENAETYHYQFTRKVYKDNIERQDKMQIIWWPGESQYYDSFMSINYNKDYSFEITSNEIEWVGMFHLDGNDIYETEMDLKPNKGIYSISLKPEKSPIVIILHGNNAKEFVKPNNITNLSIGAIAGISISCVIIATGTIFGILYGLHASGKITISIFTKKLYTIPKKYQVQTQITPASTKDIIRISQIDKLIDHQPIFKTNFSNKNVPLNITTNPIRIPPKALPNNLNK